MIVRQKAAVTLHQACASSNLYLHKIAMQQRQGYNSINRECDAPNIATLSEQAKFKMWMSRLFVIGRRHCRLKMTMRIGFPSHGNFVGMGQTSSQLWEWRWEESWVEMGITSIPNFL